MDAFEYQGADPRFNKVFNTGMSNHTIVMTKILEIYRGFKGLSSLVDVGGGIGVTLRMIVSKHPHIKGILYDLPHVIAEAVSYSGNECFHGSFQIFKLCAEPMVLTSWSSS
ncbi:hypothetical protein N665_2084s0002 [Sinapis alba]|nr:hypothetical protein N665_2084s0002 [Sinapis alba]